MQEELIGNARAAGARAKLQHIKPKERVVNGCIVQKVVILRIVNPTIGYNI